MGSWPENVGIVAMELFVPSTFVDQTELETYDGISAGKYTIGLGQERAACCTDREDIHSLCLTVVQNLMEKYDIKYTEIGRLDVGTETIVDKSKSVKSVLMQLFEPHDATDIEGNDTTHACYGGTAALFNAISWVESSAWDGRYALVVAADIGVYEEASFRPMAGAGAVAMLIGPNAPLVFDKGVRSSCMKHTYDFYKPYLASEYPIVNGKMSVQCYLNALDNCYQLYCKKSAKQKVDVSLEHFDAFVFHTPFCKMVQKAVARLALNDHVRNSGDTIKLQNDKYVHINIKNSYFDKDIEKYFLNVSKTIFDEKTKGSLFVARQVGNMCTASLYGSLVSLLVTKDISQLAGNKVGLFSFGSGLASSMFSISIAEDYSVNSPLHKLVSKLSHVKHLLTQRRCVSPEHFTSMVALREKNCNKAPFAPIGEIAWLFPGTYYLSKIDEMYRRCYRQVPAALNDSA